MDTTEILDSVCSELVPGWNEKNAMLKFAIREQLEPVVIATINAVTAKNAAVTKDDDWLEFIGGM